MPSGAWGGAGEAMASQIPIFGIAKGIFGKRLAKKTARHEKARMRAAVDSADRSLAQFEQDAEVDKQQLQMSGANRGFASSSDPMDVANQQAKLQTATQGRQRSGLQQSRDLAHQGYSLYKHQKRHAKRMGPLAFWEALTTRVGGTVAKGVTGGLDPSAAGGGGQDGGFGAFDG